jgi:hypothetical protein
MAKNLGPTFGDEVFAAGLGGLPFTWGATDDTISGRESLTTEQNATLDGVVAAHDPTDKRPNVIPTTEFVSRFTNQEWLALEKQKAADITANKVGYSKNLAVTMSEDMVDLSKQKSTRIKSDLVAAGVLTQARADEIFDTPPT